MVEFLIGAGMALLLALLAWSDSIRSLQRDTLDLEKEFSEKRNLNLRKVRTLIRSYSEPAKRIAELNKLVQSNEEIDLAVIKQLLELDQKRQDLERKNKNKYSLIIILTNMFILSGIFNYIIGENSCFNILKISIKVQFIPILLCVIFIYVTLFKTISIYKDEQKYNEKLHSINDKV